MQSSNERSGTWYRLVLLSAPTATFVRWVVDDEHGHRFCEMAEARTLALTFRDANGTELAQLRFVGGFYIPNTETYELSRGDVKLATIERRRRRFTVSTEEGEGMLVTRNRRDREHTFTRGGVLLGRLRRRRFQSGLRRSYDLVEVAKDVEPIPLLATAVLIDRSRRLKLADSFFGGP
jgi:hypothetical protein